MHAIDLVDDLVGSSMHVHIAGAMQMIAAEGRGAIVILRDGSPTALSERVRLIDGAARPPTHLRNYGIGAQILLDLGVQADGAADQHAAHHRRARGLRAQGRRPAPDRAGVRTGQ